MATTPPPTNSFPNAIRTFPTHKNFIEDVDASHINDLQNEVVAIERALGTTPWRNQTLVNSTNTWKTVAERLDYMQSRRDIPIIDLYRSAAQTFTSDQSFSAASSWVSFPAPSLDTHGLFNGSNGIKVKRSGYYYFTGSVHFADSPLKGVRELTLVKNGHSMVRSTSPMWDTGTGKAMWGSDIYLNCSIMSAVTPTDRITLAVGLDTEQYTNGKFSAVNFHLQGFLIRDL